MKTNPSVLVVDDDDAFRRVLSNELARLGFEASAAESGEEALRLIAAREPDVLLLDLQMPGMSGLEVLEALRSRGAVADVIVLTGHGSIDTAIQAIRAGAFDYIAKPCPLDELDVRIRRALERQSLRRRNSLLERGLTPPDLGSSFLGQSAAFKDVLRLIDRVAPTDSTVLITGETGAGKEMAAKLLHARSARRNRPFVTVECAALQESLLQSELFGHERGAFTGADRAKPGLFEVAHGGTIFLDEIGEVSLATQVKLLRVLDTSTFRHVGGTSELHVDVRVVAATNRQLEAMVRQGLFREDLFYRLRTITLAMPALRDRTDDVELLSGHFVALFNERYGFRKHLGADAIAALRRHPWPGNVRELLHVIEAAVIVCDGSEIRSEHLDNALRQARGIGSADGGPGTGLGDRADELPSLETLERAHIARVLDATAGHRGNAARVLGISERNLYRKLRDFGLMS